MGRAARTARLEFQKETGVSLPPLPSEEVEEKPARQLTKAERMEAAAEAALQQQKETEAAEAAELAAAHSARVEKDKQRRREEREAAAAKKREEDAKKQAEEDARKAAEEAVRLRLPSPVEPLVRGMLREARRWPLAPARNCIATQGGIASMRAHRRRASRPHPSSVSAPQPSVVHSRALPRREW